MNKIKVNLLGIPQIYIDGENIKLPFKKAEALFYYMLIEKKATRDQLVNLFWADSSEEVSKKNLRNAIYIIKKTFDIDVFQSPKRSMICLNMDLDIALDLDGDGEGNQGGEFLSGLYLKNCEDFDLWLSSQRQHYENQSINLLKQKIEEAIEKDDFATVETYCRELLALDQFDEEIYRILMQNYFNAGRFDKSIKVYKQLVEMLDEELSISPDEETVQLHNEIVKKRTQIKIAKQKVDEKFFYGRKDEMKILEDNYVGFLQGRLYNHLVLFGEAGVGKTELLNSFVNRLSPKETYVLRTFCYKATEGFILKSWDSIIEDLGQIVLNESIELPEIVKQTIISVFPAFLLGKEEIKDFQLKNKGMYEMKIIENALVELFSIVSEYRKIVIIVEDIHWTDRISLSLLERVILNPKVNMFMICTCRTGYDEVTEKFITKIGANLNQQKIFLERFSEEETRAFTKGFLEKKKIPEGLLESVYEETEGNSFFLTEFLNNIKSGDGYKVITSKIQDVLKHRILNLTKEAQKMTQIASIFFDQFTIETLIKISGKDEIEVLDTIEELLHKNILKEIMDASGRLTFMFTHQKIREFVYGDLSLSKKKILHERVAKYFELKLQKVKTDRLLYPKLIIHYQGAQNIKKVLEYSIANLYMHLQSIHEVFPIVDHQEIIDHVNVFYNERQILEEFEKLEELYERVFMEWGETDPLIKLKLSLLHMQSRYYINNGIYEKGLRYIEELIDYARDINSIAYEIKGLLVKIHYSINIHKMPLMSETIGEALALARDNDMNYEIGLLIRLSGLNKVLVGEYESGEALLKKSIEIMKSMKRKSKYILNIAAAYYYIGDSLKFRGAFKEAIEYYETAIGICNEYGVIGRLTIFYTNAGQASFNMKDRERSEKYLDKAIELYDILDFPWRRSIAYGFKGLISATNKNYGEGLVYLQKMEEQSEKTGNPYEMAVKYRIKAELSLMLKNGEISNGKMKTFLKPMTYQEYAEKGISFLTDFEHCYEMKRLLELKNS